MKLAVLAAGNPLDVATWSGTPYHMTKALLTRYPDLVPITDPRPSHFVFARKVTKKLTAGRGDIYWQSNIAEWNSNRIVHKLKAADADVLFCIGNAPLSAHLAKHIRTIHVSDATVPLMIGYYPEFTRLPTWIANSARTLDRMSVRSARAALFPTAWSANSAVKDYQAEPSRIHVIPWGANIDEATRTKYRPFADIGMCHLVFIGVDWQRKGGDIAIETALRLTNLGHPVTLHLIGGKPKITVQSELIIEHGFINKRTAEGRARFDEIMNKASFLFVPTRQDCYGMVFPEANAYGVPVISTDTGGVSGVVAEGVNGHLLPMEASADDFAKLIWSAWADKVRYNALRATSYQRFKDELNWTRWLERTSVIIDQVGSDAL